MNEPFAMFPRHLLRAGLSHGEQSVLLCLLSYKGISKNAWPSQTTIADDTGMSVRQVGRSVKSLAQKRMIAMDVQPGIRTVYTFPCLDSHPEQPAETPEPVPAPAPVVAKNATAAAPVPEPVPAPAPKPEPAPVQEPMQEPVPVATPEPAPAPEQPTDDNPSQVAAPEPQPEPAIPPAPAQPPAPEQPRAQQPAQVPVPEPAAAPVVAPVATQEQKPAPVAMPALEPAPPAPRREIVSARVARLPDVDEAVRREVDARPVIKSSGKQEVSPELWALAKRLQKQCAENTARSREQKAAAQRFEDGVTAATEQVAKQVAAQDIAAARQRAAQDAAAPAPAPAAPVTDQKPDVQPAPAPAEPVPAPEPVPEPLPAAQPAPEPVAPAPIVSPAPVVAQESPEPAPQPALPIICEPQTPAATPQQGELLPAEPKNVRKGSKTEGHRIPNDWYLTRKLGMWAKSKYGLDDDTIREQAEKFVDHWKMSSNKNAWKCDWDAAWRSWIRKHVEDSGRAPNVNAYNRPQQKSKTMQIIESFAKKYNGDFEIPF